MASAIASKLKIVTWNVNGLRSVTVDMKEFLNSLDADIICLQETKLSRDALDSSFAIVEGYNAYFSFCTTKKGYSGVVTYCKDTITPTKAEEGLSGLLPSCSQDTMIGNYDNMRNEFPKHYLREVDREGRAVLTSHQVEIAGEIGNLIVMNVYCPRADPKRPNREKFKLDFYRMVQLRTYALLDMGYRVVVAGDLNVAHRPIDHCDPGDLELFHQDPSRLWMNSIICNFHEMVHNAQPERNDPNFIQMIDTYRFVYPFQENAFTCWCTQTNARANNYGSRIDYILIDFSLVSEVSDCVILSSVIGSDHCPVKVILEMKFESSLKCPNLCSNYFPEFTGKQQKLTDFLNANSKLPPSDLICMGTSYSYNNVTKMAGTSGTAAHANQSFLTEPGTSGITQHASRRFSGFTKREFPSTSEAQSKRFKPTQKKQASILNYFGPGNTETSEDNSLSESCSSLDSTISSSSESDKVTNDVVKKQEKTPAQQLYMKSDELSVKEPVNDNQSFQEDKHNEHVANETDINIYQSINQEPRNELDQNSTCNTEVKTYHLLTTAPKPSDGGEKMQSCSEGENNFSCVNILKCLYTPNEEQNNMLSKEENIDTPLTYDTPSEDFINSETLSQESENSKSHLSYPFDGSEDSDKDSDYLVRKREFASSPLTQDESANLSWIEPCTNISTTIVVNEASEFPINFQNHKPIKSSFKTEKVETNSSSGSPAHFKINYAETGNEESSLSGSQPSFKIRNGEAINTEPGNEEGSLSGSQSSFKVQDTEEAANSTNSSSGSQSSSKTKEREPVLESNSLSGSQSSVKTEEVDSVVYRATMSSESQSSDEDEPVGSYASSSNRTRRHFPFRNYEEENTDDQSNLSSTSNLSLEEEEPRGYRRGARSLSSTSSHWRSLFSRPRSAPLCRGHREPCVMRVVRKRGRNFKCIFWVCGRGDGNENYNDSRCGHFEWDKKRR